MKAPNSLLLSCILALAVRAQEFNPSQSCWTNVDPDYDFYPVKVQADHSQFWSVEYYNTYKIIKNKYNQKMYVVFLRLHKSQITCS